jgi:hypothetical protein
VPVREADPVIEESGVRKTFTLPLAIAIALLVLAVAGCGDDATGGAGESRGQARQAEPAPASSDADAAVLWPAAPDPLEKTVAAGLQPERKEFLIHHAHAHLDVFVDGKPIVVPAGIGINIDDPEVQRFKDPDGAVAYGGITRCRRPCISPLHTHDATGIIHTESKSPEPNTLGQFFTEWGVRLGESCLGERCSPDGIAFYVTGKRYRQDPRVIELTNRKEIAIVIGTPPPEVPKTADLSKA